MVDFRPDVIYSMLGAIDAENETADRLKEYFYRNRAYDSLIADMPIRIVVGHKGVGKSALLKMAHLEDIEEQRASIWLQPSDLIDLDATYDARFDKATLGWQRGLLQVLYQRIEEMLAGFRVDQPSNILLGTSKDLISAVKLLGEKYLSLKTNDTEKAIVQKFLQSNRLYVYIDDLDRGWEGRRADILRMSTLLNALRDICGNFRGVQFRIGLRSDVYHLVRTSDESTDKVSQYIIPLTWTNHDILICIAKRIATYFGEKVDDYKISRMRQEDIARHLHRIIDPTFLWRGKWEHAPIHRVLLSLTRRRPRDLIKLLAGAAQLSYERRHQIITSDDLRSTFVSYSQDRLQDIINEFRSELPNVKALLLGMRPTKAYSIGDHPFLYAPDELSRKLKNILSSNSLIFANGDKVDFHSLKQFLYKIDFILARSESEQGRIDWTYFDENRFAASKETDFGYSWEVHPAYRWALEKKDVQQIIDGTDLVTLQ